LITVNGDPLQWSPGKTVRDVIRERNFRFPLLIVRIDGRLVPRGSYDDTEIPDGAEVDIIHLMSGG
jgi:sulfur carrier protein